MLPVEKNNGMRTVKLKTLLLQKTKGTAIIPVRKPMLYRRNHTMSGYTKTPSVRLTYFSRLVVCWIAGGCHEQYASAGTGLSPVITSCRMWLHMKAAVGPYRSKKITFAGGVNEPEGRSQLGRRTPVCKNDWKTITLRWSCITRHHSHSEWKEERLRPRAWWEKSF